MHLVARAADGARPLASRAACADLWPRLVDHFDVIACTLMPDHVHLFARVAPDGALRAFAQILSAFRARTVQDAAYECARFEWEPLPAPGEVRRDPRHIARTIRYVHLNPCRDALCHDPLEWEWSTHRDWTGAVARSCIDVRRWSGALIRSAPMGGLLVTRVRRAFLTVVLARKDARAAQATQTPAVSQAVSDARRLVVAPAEMHGKRAFGVGVMPCLPEMRVRRASRRTPGGRRPEVRGQRAFLAATRPMRSGMERAGSATAAVVGSQEMDKAGADRLVVAVVTDTIMLSSRRERSVTCSIVDGSRLVFVFGA